MIPSTVQFITGMKLRELQRQRQQFRESYRQLRRQMDAAPDAAHRLPRLYHGLQGVKFAGQPLHPEVVNLEMALRELETGTLAPDVLALWEGRLENELAAGQLRSEFVYLFGALLEEWAREGAANPVLREQSVQEGRRLLDAALAPPEPNRHAAFFASLLEGREPDLADLARRLKENRDEPDAISSILHKDLTRIATDIYRSPRVRREGREFLANRELLKELQDALDIFLADLPTWDWPAEGLSVRPLWTRNKWRLYLDLDLPTACLLEAVGASWVFIWNELFGYSNNRVEKQRTRLRELRAQNAAPAVIEHQRRQLELTRQTAVLDPADDPGVWEADSPGPAHNVDDYAEDSVRARRDEQQNALRAFRMSGGYGDRYGTQAWAVQFLHAEIQLARAPFPDRPLHVVKIDLKDFYASIPHDVLLTVLETVGVPERDRQFFRRFLSPPLLAAPGAKPVRMSRGVPMGLTLSGALAELLLRFLDLHVRRRARVRVVRLVDDVCLLTPRAEDALAGWRAVEEFCAACGLQINQAKSGAVCLGGPPPAGLPRDRPRWGMLELHDRGDWHVHAETFQAHLAQTRQRVEAAASIFARVQQYNANARFLLNALALSADLGEAHRQSTW
jgi:hypothetical protein